MLETNITRRRAVQGAGAIGLAGAIGSTAVFAQEDGIDTDGEQAALRIVHASPDAPNVDVYATPVDDVEEDGDGDPLVEDIGFRDVSNYAEVEPGAYQVRIASAEGSGFLEDIFGDEEETEEETALFEAEVEVAEGTTYTAVAFGEVAAAEPADLPMDEVEEPGAGPAAGDSEMEPAGNETDSQVEEPPGNETDSEVEPPGNETDSEVEPPGNETDSEVEPSGNETDSEVEPSGNETDSEMEPPANGPETEEPPAGETDRSFQVAVLEDDLTAPGGAGADAGAGAGDNQTEDDLIGSDDGNGEDMSRVRVFHAVPDAGSVSISTADGIEPDDDGGGLGADNESEEDEGGLGVDDDTNATDEDGAGGDTNATDENGTGGDTNVTDENGAGDMESGAASGALIEDLSFGEFDSFEAESGDYTLEIRSTGGGMVGDDLPDGSETEPSANETEDQPVNETEEPPADGPETGPANETEPPADDTEEPPADGTEEPPADGTEEDGESVQEVEVTLDEGVVYSGFAVGYFNPEQATGDDEEDGGLIGDSGEEFELVTVEDSREGERSDGGTGEGLLSVSPVPQA